MKAILSHSPPVPAGGAAQATGVARNKLSRCQGVDSLVTFVVIAWFAVALAAMVGGRDGIAPASATQAAAGTDRPAALPQASTSLGDPPHPRIRLI